MSLSEILTQCRSENDKVRIMSWTGHGPLTWLESHDVPRETLLE